MLLLWSLCIYISRYSLRRSSIAAARAPLCFSVVGGSLARSFLWHVPCGCVCLCVLCVCVCGVCACACIHKGTVEFFE